MIPTTLEAKVDDFLAQKRIAVAGVSRNNSHRYVCRRCGARYVRDKTNEQYSEKDFMLLVEPRWGWSEESRIGFT